MEKWPLFKRVYELHNMVDATSRPSPEVLLQTLVLPTLCVILLLIFSIYRMLIGLEVPQLKQLVLSN